MKTKDLKALKVIGKRLLQSYETNSMVAEQIRIVRANIKIVLRELDIKTILFTSTNLGEGKSTISANLAVSFAQEGKRVLLVDADLRRPTIHHTFNKSISPGLSNYLRVDSRLQDVLINSSIDGLDLVTSGPIPFHPAELLDSPRMEQFFEEVKEHYDLILVDAPPLLSISDARILTQCCDGTILVLSSGKTQKKDLLEVQSVLKSFKTTVIGVILNNVKLKKNPMYYDYSE